METNDESGAPEGAPDQMAVFNAEVAALRSEAGAESDVDDVLAGLGVPVEAPTEGDVKPPEEAADSTEDGGGDPKDVPPGTVPAPQGGDVVGDGLEALIAASSPSSREDKMARRSAIQEQAERLGLPQGVAKALGANVKPQEAEEYLATLAHGVQSQAADQTTGTVAPPAGTATSSPISSEVLAAVQAESGEATAKAVAEIARFAASEAQQARALAMQGAQLASETAERGEWIAAAGELSGQFQGLVRADKTIDPVAGQLAAALYANGPFAGNKRASLVAAARLHLGNKSDATRQVAQKTATPKPKTPLPSGLNAPKGQPIRSNQQAQLYAAIERKYGNDPVKRDAEYKRVGRLIMEHDRAIR